jgi:hypothetical protein
MSTWETAMWIGNVYNASFRAGVSARIRARMRAPFLRALALIRAINSGVEDL